MNYIWDLVISAEQNGQARKHISFVPAVRYSPYMELSQVDLNSIHPDRIVEVNPYYRFYDFFRDYFDVNNLEDLELRHTLFDIVIHFLAELDLYQGMNKQEYYIKFVLKDFEDGVYGRKARDAIRLFNRHERERIAVNLLRLYETGSSMYLLRETMRNIFRGSTIYLNDNGKDEMLFYVGQAETTVTRAKVELIIALFLPVHFTAEIYWRHHFGMIGVDETMRIDGIALY